MDILFIVLFGLLVGYLGGYVGISGAPFFIAFLVLTMGFQQHPAQGTVLAVMLGPMSLPAVWVMRSRFLKLWKYITICVLTYAFFSYFGASFAFALPETTLKFSFGIILLLIAYNQLKASKLSQPNAENHPSGFIVCGKPKLPINLFTIGSVGAIIGVVGGTFGIGAGVIMIPIFVYLFRIHKNDARLISLAIILPPVSIGAVIKYQQEQAIDWTVAMILLGAYLLTNFFGAQLGQKASGRRFAKHFAYTLVALGLTMVAMALYSHFK